MLHQNQLTVRSDLTVLTAVQKWFAQFCRQSIIQFDDPENQLYQLNLALAEGFTNAVRHAHRQLPPETPITIQLMMNQERIEIRIWDFGPPFDPNDLEEPKPGSLREGGGYGWFLLRRLADQVTYTPEGSGNCLLIVKYNQSKSG